MSPISREVIFSLHDFIAPTLGLVHYLQARGQGIAIRALRGAFLIQLRNSARLINQISYLLTLRMT